MNYYERHIGDYLKDTAHLSLLEHGVYTRLLDVYYTREGGIPISEVARLVGAKSKDERAALAVVLAEFFVVDADKLKQARCEVEIARFQDKQRKAKASADARWAQSERNANALQPHCEGIADGMPHAGVPVPSLQSPDTKEKKARRRADPVPCPEGVDAQVWTDWLALRKAKRAPVTQTTIAGATAEAAKAGMSLDAFLRVWCRRGSQGLEADWLKPNERGSPVGVTVQANPQIDATKEYLARQAEHAANAKGPSPEVMAKLRGVLKEAA